MSMKLTFVIPCYNEQEGIPKLLRALEETRQHIGPTYDWEVVIVDDGSSDGTADVLEAAAANAGGAISVVRHPRNRGLGAALRTGFAHATGDLIATADSDCTYDPREVVHMLRLMRPDVDIVVASPYHPKGSVHNVPAYRLLLSHNLSRLYGWVTGADLFTYTSLFRVYRARVLRNVQFESDGFLSMAQILVSALLAGYQAVEYPTQLTVREYGESKAAIAKLIRDHARYLLRLMRSGARLKIGAPAAPLVAMEPMSAEQTDLQGEHKE
jgi:dolichol-phosphate mannosyltransferase